MKITVKQLQGGECILEVLPTTSVLEVKQQIFEKLNVSVEEQKLLVLGRNLADDKSLQDYPIKDGTRVNLVVKKPEGLYEVAMKQFKKLGMTDREAVNSTNRLMKVVQDKFNRLSWDDIDRLLLDCLMDESGQRRTIDSEMNVDGEETLT